MLHSHLVAFYMDIPFKRVLLCGFNQQLPLFAWTICAVTAHKGLGQDKGKMEIVQTAVYDKNEG